VPEKPLVVDLVRIVVKDFKVHLEFRDANSCDHGKSYTATAFLTALPKLMSPKLETRVIGLQLLGMYRATGRRVFLLVFDDSKVGHMGVPSDHGPANDLELLLHPQSGRGQQLTAMLRNQRAVSFVMDNPRS
jgi:hypothetical protein